MTDHDGHTIQAMVLAGKTVAITAKQDAEMHAIAEEALTKSCAAVGCVPTAVHKTAVLDGAVTTVGGRTIPHADIHQYEAAARKRAERERP